MLITLSANSLRSVLSTGKKGKSAAALLSLTDLPRYTRETLGLHGLNLSTAFLAGADLKRLDAVRDAADKASCPCLVLIEPDPLPYGHDNEAKGEAAVQRMIRVMQAAHRLGCNSAATLVAPSDAEDELENAVDRLRRVMRAAERLEVNLLIGTNKGLTAEPESLTDLIKKVGGFRIGTFPDYEVASKAPDPLVFLRRLTPYAAALTVASIAFKPSKKSGSGGFAHEPYDLAEYTKVVVSVGYQGTLAIEYRGDENPEENIKRTRAVLESIVGDQPQKDAPSEAEEAVEE